MADKVIIWPNDQAPVDTYYWVEDDSTETPVFTTNLENAKRYSEDTVDDALEEINENNTSLHVYSGNPTSPPPKPF